MFTTTHDPEEWASAHVELGYRAAYCPPDAMIADPEAIAAVRRALARHDVVLAEVGAWVNPVDPDPEVARRNRDYLAERLALADELGARCCVDIVGSWRPDKWDGADPRGYSPEFVEAVVDAFREIIDAAAPTRTVMAFEAMPFYFLDGPAPYLDLLAAIDRPGQVGVHVDLCNMITGARRFYASGDLAREVFRLLGPQVRSVHLKDLTLDDDGGTVKLLEVMPGTGGIDLAGYLTAAATLPDCPVLLEHLPDEAAYDEARTRVRAVARGAGLDI